MRADSLKTKYFYATAYLIIYLLTLDDVVPFRMDFSFSKINKMHSLVDCIMKNIINKICCVDVDCFVMFLRCA